MLRSDVYAVGHLHRLGGGAAFVWAGAVLSFREEDEGQEPSDLAHHVDSLKPALGPLRTFSPILPSLPTPSRRTSVVFWPAAGGYKRMNWKRVVTALAMSVGLLIAQSGNTFKGRLGK